MGPGLPEVQTINHMNGHESCLLPKATLIYSDASHQSGYATVHEATNRDGTDPGTIMAGCPLDKEALSGIVRLLSGASHVSMELFSEMALYADPARMLWWSRPALQRVCIETRRDLRQGRIQNTSHPALQPGVD